MSHLHFLEKLYKSAPINQKFFEASELKVSEKQANITLPISEDMFHAGKSLHGAVYFKLLDDAAYFAAASIEKEYFLLTKDYQIEFKRPVFGGKLFAEGTLGEVIENGYIASSVIKNEEGKIVAQGRGEFAKSRTKIGELN